MASNRLNIVATVFEGKFHKVSECLPCDVSFDLDTWFQSQDVLGVTEGGGMVICSYRVFRSVRIEDSWVGCDDDGYGGVDIMFWAELPSTSHLFNQGERP